MVIELSKKAINIKNKNIIKRKDSNLILLSFCDNIIVVKNKGRLKKYDVPVYVTKQGKYIMHRIVKVCDDHYVIVGDNLIKKEYVTDDMICGVLVGFYKDGKKYIDCQNSKAYKLYSKIWVALLPVRPFILLFPRGINWIKRHIFKKR